MTVELSAEERAAAEAALVDGRPGDGGDALEVTSARALCELPDPPGEDEFLGSLLVRGQRVIIGGHTGEGKTTLALQLARALSEREDFLGWSGAGGRVLVIDAEQGLRTIKRRLREARLDASEAIEYLRVPDGLRLDSDEREIAAVERLLADGEYRLVIADPLYKLHAGDSNAERKAVDLMRRFDEWRERFGFALALPMHCRKPPLGGKFTMHEFFGSSAYLRGAEVVLGLQRLRPGYARLHFFKDRDGDLPVGEAWGLVFDRKGGFRRDPEDGKAKPTAPERVHELLEANPGMRIEALMEATGYADRTVRDALRAVGAVASGMPKRWEIPAEQEELA